MSNTVRRRLILAALVIVVAIITIFTPIWHDFQSGAQIIIKPPVLAMNYLVDNLSALIKAPSIERDNETLRQEVARLSASNAEIARLKEENLYLRQLNSIPVTQPFKPLGAEIIGEQNDDTGKTYLINLGSHDGVQVGMPLVAGITSETKNTTAVLVGIISSVTPEISTFAPTTASTTQVVAEVVNKDHSLGLTTGEHNLAIRLKFIPLAQELTAGDYAVTSNSDSLIPAGLLIGQITTIEKDPSAFFQSAIIAPPTTLEKFHYLYILKR